MTSLPITQACDYCNEISRDLKRYNKSPNLYNNTLDSYFLCEQCRNKLDGSNSK